MDAKPLPPRPSLEQYRTQAKDLLHDARDGDRDAIRRLLECPRVDEQSSRRGAVRYALADAQYIIAREHGFESWPRFARHVEALAYQEAPVARFEAAADAVVAGDATTLERVLHEDPSLVRARSTRAHHATLLHYVAANGVEDFRQRTPEEALAVARMLLEAGADPNASADTYGGGAHQTTLNLLVSSVHPARAGLQVALVDLLLDFGAAMEAAGGDGSALHTSLAFHYPAAAEALVRRGAPARDILAAAGLGREDLVGRFVGPNGELAAEARPPRVPWLRFTRDDRSQLERALIWAAALGHPSVVDFLARRGVSVEAADEQGLTALHWAAMHGHLDVVDVLLRRGAPLEARNIYGGTVLGGTVWAALHGVVTYDASGFVPVDHVGIIERLIGAGARVQAVEFPTGLGAVDAVLARHGARAT